jgi:PAS domain S-box-containing protein
VENILAQERELLSATLASIGDAVIITDAQGRVRFLNPEAERLTGWNSSEANGRPLAEVFRIVNEKTRKPVEDPVEKVFRLGTVIGLANHTILISRDGRETPIDDSASPIRKGNAPVAGVVLIFRDVTAQRQAQAASAQLAAIVEHSGDAIFTKDLNGIIQTWNAGAQRLFGYTAEEIIGKHISIIFPPERLSEEDEILARLRQGKASERLETVRVRKDGKPLTVSVSISPLRDAEGNVVGASKIIHDISGIKRAQGAVAASEQRLKGIIASAMDAVITMDEQQKIVLFNPAAEKMFGVTTEQALGKHIEMLIPPRFRHAHSGYVQAFGKTGVTSRQMGALGSISGVRANGEEFPIEASISQTDVGGEKLYTVILRDITERRRTEEELRQARALLQHQNERLEAMVNERTAKLRDMIAELQHVSYAISHDMRAPLRAMNAFATALREEIGKGMDTDLARDFCRRIILGSSRLDKLITDALNYTKAVLMEVQMQPVDLNALLRGILDTYPNLHSDHADIAIENTLPTVLGNEALLTQCFANLLGNAVKFIAPGVRPQVRIRAEPAGELARISITDNGIGIPRVAQARLFGMFQKLDSSYEGTGIGLAIVRKVVERMGGRVGAESEGGQGSCFWVELPPAKEGSPGQEH